LGLSVLIGCSILCGCSSQDSNTQQSTDNRQNGQLTSSPAASADQALWQLCTKKAEEALSRNDKVAAEANYKIAIAEAEKLGEDNPGVAASTANLADFYYVQGEGNKADDLYKRSLAVQEKTLGTEHADLIKDLIGLGKVALLNKQKKDALAYFQRAEAIAKKSNLPISTELEQGLKKSE
jgi:tetratricopeptide (TPR) repeat protein